MIFRRFFHFETGCAAYVFGCGTLGQAAVVDGRIEDIEGYQTFSASKGMAITTVIDTHIHADHRSGGRTLAAKVGAKYCLYGSAEVDLPFEHLRDNQLLDLGNTRIKVMHTPGHTPESVCLLVTDFKRGSEPWFVLTGDTLFVGAVGRPDLPGNARQNAAELFESIHQKLLTLPEDIEIYPAHFSGSSCGAGMSGKPSSTIGYERRWNPMLALDRGSFIDKLSKIPAKPAGLDHHLAFNRGLG